ncbi:MAG: hypothetical protein GY811_05510 [Myxococcales bacterium]|nr:hypothetical protein [Myxococcales bacterium]
MLKVYPALVKDLKTVATTGQTIKQTFTMGAGENASVKVAIVMSTPPVESSATAAIHIALHPLG